MQLTRRRYFIVVAVLAALVGIFSISRIDPVNEAGSRKAAGTVDTKGESEVPSRKTPRTEGSSETVTTNAGAVSEVDRNGVDFTPLHRFNGWAHRYLEARTPVEKSEMRKEGVQLAKERRSQFLQLIKTDPERAIQEAVPMVVRQGLPKDVVAQLEERVSGVGLLKTYMGAPVPGEATPVPAIRYLVLEDGQSYETHTYGREANQVLWKNNRSANGVAMKGETGMAQLALNPSPIRRLEEGERPDSAAAKVEECPVSGKSTALPPEQADKPITSATPAVEADGRIVYLCNGSHVTIYEDRLIQRETVIQGSNSSGGGQPFTGSLPYAQTQALGILKVLYIRAMFPDDNIAPTDEATPYATMKKVHDYYSASSYGKLTTLTTVTPCVMMPHDSIWYKTNDSYYGGTLDCLGMTHDDARAGAKALGYDPANYDCIVVLTNSPNNVTRAAGGWGGGNSVWVYSPTWTGVLAHEIGHTFGLGHAQFWDTGGKSAIGGGSVQGYGNDYDVMGSGNDPQAQYNLRAKDQIGWLNSNNLTSVAESGTYRVYAHDANTLEPERRYGLKIVKDTQRTYYVEARQLWAGDSNQPWLNNGVQLLWDWDAKTSNGLLLDTTPGSINGKRDGNVIVGRTFSDRESGIHITPVAVDSSGAQKWVDVVVKLGRFSANQAPTLTLNSSALNVPVGSTVNFTANATDADGDTLAYHWSYGNGDKTALPNAPSISRTFSSAGRYWVGCTVSDMKGGIAVRYAVINVGTPATYNIGGRITAGGQPLVNVLVSTSGKEVYTDSDGYYTLVGLGAGGYSVTPLLDGYTFDGTLPSPIMVGPNVENANFDAVAGTFLTLTASVQNCVEGGASPGKFTLTRTGPTASALTVQLQTISGTATPTTDYTLAPAIANNTLTIPAGKASLDVTVTPVNDASAEGTETVRMLLLPDASYVTSGLGEATVTIDDDDTTLPKASIAANKPVTVENSGQPAQFTVSRTGATTSALTVNYTVSGTATSGTDFTAIANSVTIPSGASSAVISINTVNDNVSESNESVIISLANSGSYIVEPTASAATATIVDDDVQVVNVSVADAIGTKGTNPADNATFIVTRTGDVSQPLTVYYGFSGSAQQAVDFYNTPGFVIIPAGLASAAVTIVPFDDGVGSIPRTVMLQLASASSNYKVGSSGSGTVTIHPNVANVPYVNVQSMDDSVSEPGDTGTFRFTASGGANAPVVVKYAVSGTATSGTDYTALTGSVTIPAGTDLRTVDVTVTPLNDALLEDLENIVVTITPDPAYQTWTPDNSAAMWLRDDDQPTVFVDAHSVAPTEAGTASKFFISRSGSTTNALTVNYTMSGTATNGSDYSLLNGSVTIPAGASYVNVPVTPTNDSLVEGTETITMTLAAGSYSRSPLSATLYLQDNEIPTTQVAFNSAASAVSESAGTVNIPVSLSASATGAVTVDYAVSSGNSSTDYSSSGGRSAPYWVRLVRTGSTITAYSAPDSGGAAGTWTQQGTARTIPFADPVLVGLAYATNNNTQGIATFDNVTVTPGGGAFTGQDVGYVSGVGSDSVAGGTYTLTAQTGEIWGSSDSFHYVYQQLSGDCSITARVTGMANTHEWATAGVMIRQTNASNSPHGMMSLTPGNGTEFLWRAGSITSATGSGVDYALAKGTLTFAPGETTKNIPVPITDDKFNEPTETLVLSLSNSSNASLGTNKQHTLSITDNDPLPTQPTVGFAAQASSGNEAVTPANIIVSLSAPSTSAVTVNYAATGGTASGGGTDYTITSGTLSFAPGETAKVMPNTIVDDATAEPDETIVLTLSAPTGASLNANSAHTYTILNDDTPTVTIAATDASATENADSGTFTVTRTGVTTSPLTVNFAVSGSATSGADYAALGTSVTISAGQASRTIDVNTLNDSANEAAETVVVTLSSDAAYVVGATNAATVTINDDDMPVINITATDGVSSEPGTDTGTFTVTRTGVTTSALTVNFSVSGTATKDADYTSIGTSVIIPAGQSSQIITLTPKDDATSEGQEYLLVSLTPNSNYNLGSSTFASVVINDDDNAPVVQITSPVTPSVVLNNGTNLLLQATASDDGTPGPLTTTWSKVSGPGTVTFGSPDATETTAVFSAAGDYVIRFTGNDGAQSTVDDLAVNVGGDDSLSARDIGASVSNGSYAASSGTHTIAVRSGDLWGAADSFRFAFEQVRGDVTVTARVFSQSNTAPWAKAGVMIRESIVAGSMYAMECVTPSNGTAMQWRSSPDAGSGSTSTTGRVAPYWVRLTRIGNTLTGYASPDGVNWTQQDTKTITMAADLYVGLCVASNNTSSTCTAVFDNYSVTPLVNKGAVVNAGSDQSSTSNIVNIAGSATDDAKPAALTTTWTKVSGPGSVSFGNASSGSTTANFSMEGTYTLRLLANDGAAITFDDLVVAVTSTPGNQAPVFSSDTMSKPDATEDVAYNGQTLAGSATDGNANDTLTYSKVSGPAWLSVAANGALSGTPANGDVGPNSFTIRVTDSGGFIDEATLTINVANVNDAPTFTSSPINGPGATGGVAYSGTISGTATDVDAGDTLTYAKVSGPAWLNIAADGTMSGTPVSGDGANSFIVSVTDNGGLSSQATLNINVSGSIGNGVWVNAAGGSWPIVGNWSGNVMASGIDKTADFSTLNLTADATVTLDGARTISNLIFGDTTPSNNWILNAGTGGALTLDITSGTPAITVNNQSTTINLALAGTKGLNKAGAGTLVLTGSNTYTGVTNVNAGTLAVGNVTLVDGSLITVAQGAVFESRGQLLTNAIGPNQIASITGSGTLALRSTTNSATSPDIYFNANNANNNTSTANSGTSIDTAVDLGVSQRYVWGKTNHNSVSKYLASQYGADANFKGAISGSGGLTFVAQNTFTDSDPARTMEVPFVLSGNNSFTGPLEIQRGSLYLNHANALAQGNALLMNPAAGNNSRLFLYGNNASVSNLTSSGSGIASIANGNAATDSKVLATGTLTVNQTSATTYAGTLVNYIAEFNAGGSNAQGPLALVKKGPATLILSGANTYTGATNVNEGALMIQGGLANTTTVVASAGTLGGNGTIAGAVTSNGTLSPGNNGIGTLTVNNTLSLTGTTVMEVSKSGTTLSCDRVQGVTSLAQGGVLKITKTGAALVAGDSFALFGANTFSGSFSSFELPVLDSGLSWNTYQLATTGTISVRSMATQQTITFGPLPNKSYGDAAFTLTASASSGLPVSYSSSNTAVVTVSGSTANIVGAGSAMITASQQGNETYEPANNVSQSLTVNAILPAVSTTAASAITSNSASAGGNVTSEGGANVTARGVCWSVNANPTIADGKTSNGSGSGTFTSALSPLTPGTLYHIRAYATNTAGTAYGSDLTFTTPLDDNFTWTNGSGGSWPVASNWLYQSIGNGASKTIRFDTLDLTADAVVTLDGARTVGNLIFSDTTPSNNWTINTGSPSGSLTLSGTTPTITVSNQSATLGMVLAGTSGLVKSGDGALNLGNVGNTFSGNILVSRGILQTGSSQGGSSNGYLGQVSGSRTVTVSSGANLSFTGNNVFGGGGKSASTIPSITINGGSVSSTRYNIIGNLTLNGASLVQSTTDSGGYEGYQFLGMVTVSGSAPSTISSTNNKANHLFNGTTTFDVSDVTGSAVADLTISNPLKNSSNDYTPNAGSLTKIGAGTMAFTGASTYTGATSITNGTLLANNATGSATGTGAVNVSADGTLGGTGFMGGAVTNNGTLAPGSNGVGNLTVNNSQLTTLAGGSTIAWEISNWTGSAGTGWDKLTVNTLDLTATSTSPITIKLAGLSLENFTEVSKTFQLIQVTSTAASPITGFAANKFIIDATGLTLPRGTWAVELSGKNINLVYTADANANGISDNWEITKFGNANAGANPADGDPDKDGMSNLMEYALDTHPMTSNSNPIIHDIEPVGAGKYLRMTVTKNPEATNLTYIVETCDALNNWSTADTVIEQAGSPLVVRDKISTTTAPRRFIRLKVVTAP